MYDVLIEVVRALDEHAADYIGSSLTIYSVKSLFTWAHTPQGYFYWFDLHEKLKGIYGVDYPDKFSKLAEELC